MNSQSSGRRAFIKGSVSALVLSSFPDRSAFGQSTIRIRPEWEEFKNTVHYASFIDAIRTMRANTNPYDRSSWRFWSDAHVNFGLHNAAYFLPWHRGYLYYFEQQLRIVSGNNELVVPYWDIYKSPVIPAEFTDAASGNPLYVPRVNANVYSALTLAPFGPTVWNFQRGQINAFETLMETQPHNPVHDIVGGFMGTMRAPLDPIFFLHHANIDRLWHAWALPDGKGIPSLSSTYWAGNFTYAPDLTLPRAACYHPHRLNFDYADLTLPTALPPLAGKGRIIRVQAQQAQQGRRYGRPPVGAFSTTEPRSLGAGRRSIGGAREVDLTENSVSVQIPVQAADRQSLQAIAGRVKKGDKGKGTALPQDAYKSVNIMLDDVKLLPAGKLGGFFYRAYLNLPDNEDGLAALEPYLLGTVGPFEIEAASHHAHHGGRTQLVFPATEVLANLAASDVKVFTVSLVRFSGDKFPKGRVISVGELRLEMSAEEPFEPESSAPPGTRSAYR